MAILLLLFLFSEIYFVVKYFEMKKRIKVLKENLEFQDEYSAVPKSPVADDGDLLAISKTFDELKCKLIHLENEKEELEQEYQRMTSDLSHDLRTPLTAMLGYLDLIREDPAKVSLYLDTVEEKAIYLKELTDKFYELFLTRERAYRDFEYLNLKELVAEKTFFYYDKLTEKNQDIEIEGPADCRIYSSREGLDKILVNILDNMLKYSRGENRILVRANPLTLEFSNATDLPDGDYDRFFDRFKVADASRKNSTGIGLSIVKNVVDQLGFEVHGWVKEGRFYVSLVERDRPGFN